MSLVTEIFLKWISANHDFYSIADAIPVVVEVDIVGDSEEFNGANIR